MKLFVPVRFKQAKEKIIFFVFSPKGKVLITSNTEKLHWFRQAVLLLLVLMSFAVSHPVIPAAAGELDQQQHIEDRSTVLDMEPSESKVKKFYKGTGYGYGGKDEFFKKTLIQPKRKMSEMIELMHRLRIASCWKILPDCRGNCFSGIPFTYGLWQLLWLRWIRWLRRSDSLFAGLQLRSINQPKQ